MKPNPYIKKDLAIQWVEAVGKLDTLLWRIKRGLDDGHLTENDVRDVLSLRLDDAQKKFENLKR